MAAQMAQLPGRGERTVESVAPATIPEERPSQGIVLPFPTPILHSRAVEALLLAFRPLDEQQP